MAFPGRVTSINEHHSSSKHASIEVTHGKRKRSKGADGEKGELQGYDRPTSRVVVPKSHAKNFTMGQKVNVHVSPATEAEDDGSMENDGDEDDMPTAPAKGSKTGKGGKASSAKRPRPILAAMTKGRSR